MAFKLIRDVDDPVSAGDLVRVQQNVQAAFQELDAGGDNPMPTTRGPNFRASGVELVIFVDSRGGPVTVVLPDAPKAPLALRNVGGSANAITVKTTGPLIDGARSVELADKLQLAFDGRAWWSI